jgi:hypothetical protein
VSSDFSALTDDADARVQQIQSAWKGSTDAQAVTQKINERLHMAEKEMAVVVDELARAGTIKIITALLHRSFIKSYRDVVAYGIRIVMYLGEYICCLVSDSN